MCPIGSLVFFLTSATILHFFFGVFLHFSTDDDKGHEAEQASLNNEIIGLEDWVGIREEVDNSFDQSAALVEKYVDIPELTPTIVNEFIKKIIVYVPEKQDTKRIQKVRIIFNFLDNLDTSEIGEPIITETTYCRGKTA